MKRALVVVALLGLVAVGAAYATGVGPAPGGADERVESFPVATPAGNASGDTIATGPPFTFTVDRIEQCGRTCRDVTATLTNEHSTTARNVTVYIRIYAGNGTDGTVVWEGTDSVGQLAPGESHTATRHVRLSLTEGYAVRSADGWITIQTTVRTNDRTVPFTQRRNVT